MNQKDKNASPKKINFATFSKRSFIALSFSIVACASTPEAPPPEAQSPVKKEAAKTDAFSSIQGPAVTSSAVSADTNKANETAKTAAASTIITPSTSETAVENKSETKEPAKKSEASSASTESASSPKATSEAAAAAKATPATVNTSKEAPAKEAAAHTATADAHGGGHAREVGKVSWDKSLGWLKNGNNRFRKGFLRKDGTSAAEREALVAGQHPHAIVLSCSDSRVPPEVLFDQKLGEIFVVRTAGEALDSAALASIEYAVSHLGPNLIVVMGHEACGAVKAAFGTLSGEDAGSAWLNKLVADIHPRIMSFKGKTLSKGALEEGWANVHGVAKDLIERSDIVREAVESGSLKIAKGLYHLGSGEVEWKE